MNMGGCDSCHELLSRINSHLPEDRHKERRMIASLCAGLHRWREKLSGSVRDKANRPGDVAVNAVMGGAALWLKTNCRPFGKIIKRKPQDNSDSEDDLTLVEVLAEILIRLKGGFAQRMRFIEKQSSNTATAEQVALMTLHASKGLEFDNVWILGLEENNLPHPDAKEEEERASFISG